MLKNILLLRGNADFNQLLTESSTTSNRMNCINLVAHLAASHGCNQQVASTRWWFRRDACPGARMRWWRRCHLKGRRTAPQPGPAGTEQRDRPIRQRPNRETPAIRAGQPACMPWSRSPLRNACCVRNVSNLDIALISAGAALGGVLLGQVSAYVSDRLKEHRAARDARDQAIADVLTAVVDLVTGVQAIRAAYEGQSGWRQLARRAAVLLSAFGSEYGSPAGLRVDEILDWKRLAPFFDSLLVYMRDMDHRQRIQALDVGTMLLPRTDRFYSAVAVLSLGPDKDVARAVRKLTPAVGALLEAAGEPQRKYDRARRRAENALGAFRDAVDARRGA